MNATKLRELAEAATPGPWIAKDWAITDNDGAVNVCGTSVSAPNTNQGIFTTVLEGDDTNDVDYIAAANPAAVLALLDHIKELEDELRACVGSLEYVETTYPLHAGYRVRQHRMDTARTLLEKSK